MAYASQDDLIDAGVACARFSAIHGPPMFVVLSRFTIKNDMAKDVRAAFQSRPHLVDQAPGLAPGVA